ncbi:hypothetical protein [Chitinivorax sp. B]|nr:hypothetical protein [Chitinivorax sp. B]
MLTLQLIEAINTCLKLKLPQWVADDCLSHLADAVLVSWMFQIENE